MLEDATSTESLDAIARKKELLLQRLQQRRPVKHAGSALITLQFLDCNDAHPHCLGNQVNSPIEGIYHPSTVHIQGVHDCKLVFLPVDTSILVYDCT
ncbi:hypothetical protein OSTOST_25558, partial [Ostertagia ostertagi]